MKIDTKTLPAIMLMLLSVGDVSANTAIEIDDAWIAEAPPVSKVMAAYMKIENASRNDRQVTSMQCEEFERAEFHRTVEEDGVARMEPQRVLNIKADSELLLEPGGYHIMLYNPGRRLQAGDQTGCRITLDDGTTLGIDLPVRKPSVDDHTHHHHH